MLVASEGATTSTIVDLDTGETNPSELPPDTAFTDGDSLSWGRSDMSLDWGTRPDVHTLANNAGGLVEYPPLVKDGVAVGDMSVGSREVGSEDPPLGNGVVAVDATTGDVLAYLPTGPGPGLSVLLGWQGDLPVLGLKDDTGKHHTMAIVAWDYQAGTTRAARPDIQQRRGLERPHRLIRSSGSARGAQPCWRACRARSRASGPAGGAACRDEVGPATSCAPGTPFSTTKEA